MTEVVGNVARSETLPVPTWRVIGLDETLFVSAFGEDHEGHRSPMYRITRTSSGALHRDFVRFCDELRSTAERVI